MRMEQVEVYCSDKGFVVIKTDGVGYGNSPGNNMIILTTDQVPVVIKWITAAMNKALEMEASA